MSELGQIFGLASVTAYIRENGNPLVSGMIEAMNIGFGGVSGDGMYVYNLYNSNSGSLLQTNGLNLSNTNYSLLENSVNSFYNDSHNVCTIGTAAIVYGYANYSNYDEDLMVEYINNYNKIISPQFNLPVITISDTTLETFLSSFTLSGINQSIANSPSGATYTGSAVNYNWYDSSILFANLSNLGLDQTIKDIENQYYYVSGELLYSYFPTGLDNCIYANVTINTSTGSFQISVIKNTPCYDPTSYIGPLSGIKFFRVFNDGPGSSGYFDSTVTGKYVQFDKDVLPYNAYSSNDDILYSYYVDNSGNYIYLCSGVQVDIPGVFSPTAEYGYGHTNYMDLTCSYPETGFPLMRMHQGDNRPKWYDYTVLNPDRSCSGYSILENWTGWKFAGLELENYWSGHFSSIQTNPFISIPRILKRALNLNNSIEDNQSITPYYNVADTGDGTLTCLTQQLSQGNPYVGPPQLNGTSSLPGFTFYQTFYNQTFPDNIQIVMRPAISISDGVSINSDSQRTFEISNFDIFSGTDFASFDLQQKPSLLIYTGISSSNIGNYDNIFKECLSMGDNFQNQATETSGLEANAGFLYTGYTYYINGNQVSQSNLLSSGVVIGNTYSQVNYINGYKNLSNGQIYSLSTFEADIITGDTSTGINYTGFPVLYSYFPYGVLGATNTQWASFAPIPSGVLNNPSNYEPIYISQPVENYFPRYSSGPYASYITKFLYPNAQSIATTYNSIAKGFPYKAKYQLTIKEETVREIYLTSGIYYGNTNYVQIVRAGTNSLPMNLGTTMIDPFSANGSTFLRNTYDFTKNTSLYPINGEFFNQAYIGDFVDQNWVPNRNGCTNLNLNSVTYGGVDNTFVCGVRYTGNLIQRNLNTGGIIPKIVVVSEPVGNGLYWGYKGEQITGEVTYSSPLFDLSSYSLNPSNALINAIFNKITQITSPAFSNDGSIRYGTLLNSDGSYDGKDPIYYQYIGGRSGSGANLEGGYHTKGIIGDQWYDFELQNWGTQQFPDCVNPLGRNTIRYPQYDSYFSLLALNATGLNIFTKGLNYYPYYNGYTYNPFLTTDSLPNIGVSTSPIKIGKEYYFNFNLKNQFPIINNTGLYSSTGLVLGPFDRDTEFCVTGNNTLIPSGYLIIDGEQLTFDSLDGCPINNIEDFGQNSGIIPGQANRNAILTTFKIIPSGAITNINISGSGLIGFKNNSIVTIRPRTILGGIFPQTNPLSGDLSIMDSFRYINNGTESIFNFNSSTFENLAGQGISLITNPRTQVLYPIPGSDFDSILNPSIDSFGNKTYNQPNPTLYYWRQKTPNAYYSGIRETTRVYVSIDSFQSEMGPIPYQNFLNIIPSGSCIISGVFAYSGEAESAILTEGIVLSGSNQSGLSASLMTGFYQPIYISPVLSSLPTGIFILPTGGTIDPILPAPSLEKIRKNPYILTGNDVYVNNAPPGSNYNEFLWPALSDLATLNPEFVYEELPPADGYVFGGSNLLFSASQGQNIGTGFNPVENVTYDVIANYLLLNSTSTNSSYNTGICIINPPGVETILNSGDLTGILTIQGTPLTMAVAFQN